MLLRYAFFDVEFLGPARFLRKGFRSIFLNNTFHVGIRQITQNLILYKMLVLYPRIVFINKRLSVVQELHVRCDSLKVF